MIEKRRHQRIRFGNPPSVSIGYRGAIGLGTIENLSLSGLMLRTAMALEIGKTIGCEFSVFGSPRIDIPASVVSRIGDQLFGLRFETGPINEILLEDAIVSAIAGGHASILSVHESAAGKLMRIVGGLNATLRNDFMHSLTRVGIKEIDASAVTATDSAGISLCLLAQRQYGVSIGQQSKTFASAWQAALRLPAGAEARL